MEPTEYFRRIKTSFKDNDLEQLQKQLEVIREQIILSHLVGQKNFLEKLMFTHDVIVREQELVTKGYTKYLLNSDILAFIDKVKPKNSIKVIELERFPRPIPQKNLADILIAKETELFDDFFVVFTDFTDESYESQEDKELVARNRDPVVFGWFKNEETGFKHDRVIFITDWQDEYCDLDFSTLVVKMAETLPHFKGEGALEYGKIAFDKNVFEGIMGTYRQKANQTNDIQEKKITEDTLDTVDTFFTKVKKFIWKKSI
jgi:hypothetical protein